MRSLTFRSHPLFGLVLGFLLFIFAAGPIYAQTSNKITAAGGWNLCVDFQASNVALTVGIDGAAAIPAAGVTWVGSTAPFQAQIPLSQLPAGARTIGLHSVIVTAPSSTVTLADGSSLTVPGGSLTVAYEIVNTVGPAPSNPRWIKIAGTIAAFIGAGLVAWFAASHG
jgi:hypothetical protein